jgi:hypothetical protein
LEGLMGITRVTQDRIILRKIAAERTQTRMTTNRMKISIAYTPSCFAFS